MTKKLNEDFAKMYYENYRFNSVGLRFFTVFGEWGRPDMFLFKYLSSITNKKKFILNNRGKHYRDFTYIHDVIKVLFKSFIPLALLSILQLIEYFELIGNEPPSLIIHIASLCFINFTAVLC